MMKLRLTVELPVVHRESGQPEPLHHLVPATWQRSLGNAMVLLVWRAALSQIQGERNALLAAVKEAVVEGW
jgi:hypothetical protein